MLQMAPGSGPHSILAICPKHPQPLQNTSQNLLRDRLPSPWTPYTPEIGPCASQSMRTAQNQASDRRSATTPTNQTPPSYPPLPQYPRASAIQSRPKACGTHGSPAVLRRHCPILGELIDGFGRRGWRQRATELRHRRIREFISNRPTPMGSTSWGHLEHRPECVRRATSGGK